MQKKEKDRLSMYPRRSRREENEKPNDDSIYISK
jgi:hypothetical protein